MQNLRARTNFIDHLSPMNKSIVLLMCITGMNTDDITDLTFCDFVNSIGHYLDKTVCPFDISEIGNLLYSNDEIIGIWEMDDSTIFLSSQECILSILDYLESEGDQCIPFDKPLFQFDDRGKLTKKYILSIFQEIEILLQGDTE